MKMSALAVAAIVLPALTASAQRPPAPADRDDAAGMMVFGVVEVETTGRRLMGAQVEVVGLRPGTVTDSQGRYVLQGVPRHNVALRVTLSGYVSKTREVWVCTPVLYPGGTCYPDPGPPEDQRLDFFMRAAPSARVR